MNRSTTASLVRTAALLLVVAGAGGTGAITLDDHPVGGPQPGAASTPTLVADADGAIWAAWVEGQSVRVSRSTDRGRTFAPAVTVTSDEEIDANGESRPSLVVSGEHVYVAWTRKGTKPYTGDIRFAASRDGGRTFSPPVTVNDDGLQTGHRFQSIAALPDGRLFIAWIDKRDAERARTAGRPYDGGALYFAVSRDRGRTFEANRKVKDHVCECCRLSLIVAPDGAPAILFRDIIPDSIRDHALVRFSPALDPLPVERVTFDGWQIQACPHHGPSLAADADGTLHMAWFTGAGPEGPGQFYARATQGTAFDAPRRLGTVDSLGHADILVMGPVVHVAWKDRSNDGAIVLGTIRSSDGGRTWSPPADVLEGTGSTDYPQLLALGPTAHLAWFTSKEGLRVVPLAADQTSRR